MDQDDAALSSSSSSHSSVANVDSVSTESTHTYFYWDTELPWFTGAVPISR